MWAAGPAEHTPELPQMEFMSVAPAQRYVSKKLQQCNWAQACEGALDTRTFRSAHVGW